MFYCGYMPLQIMVVAFEENLFFQDLKANNKIHKLMWNSTRWSYLLAPNSQISIQFPRGDHLRLPCCHKICVQNRWRHEVLLIALAEIPEREESIWPFSFYGELPNFYSQALALSIKYMSSYLCSWCSWAKWKRWEDLRFHLFVFGVNQGNDGGRIVQDSLVLPQECGSFPAVVLWARWYNLVRVECLLMIKPMVVVFVLVEGGRW